MEISGTIKLKEVDSEFLCKVFGYPKLEINGKDVGYIQKIETLNQEFNDDYVEVECKFSVINPSTSHNQ